MTKNNLLRMDNIGIVVESLDEAISFFSELGLKLEGGAMIEGEWAERVTGLGDQSIEIAMMVTPHGHSRLELSRFLTPPVVADHRNAPVNASATYGSCLPWTRSTRCSTGSVSTALSSLAKWFNTRTRIGSATFADPKDFS